MQQVRVGVGVIINCDGKILLGQRKGSHGAGCWSVPGGHLDFGESPVDCAKREVYEETGARIQNVQLMPYTSNDIFSAEGKHYITLWVYSTLPSTEKKTVSLREPEKCNGWKWFDWTELPQPLFLPMEHFVKDQPFFKSVLAVNIHPGLDHVQASR